MRILPRVALTVLGFAGIAATGWVARPQPCDFGLDGGISLASWPGNVLARIGAWEEDCEVWARIDAEPVSGPFEVSWSINAYAGPESHIAMFHPDGMVEVWRDNLSSEDRGRNRAVILHDPALYALAVERFSPMRDWSQPSDFGEFVEDEVAKTPIDCSSEGYHSDLTIFWGGFPDGPEDTLDFSYIKTDAGRECPAEFAAWARYLEVREAIDERLIVEHQQAP